MSYRLSFFLGGGTLLAFNISWGKTRYLFFFLEGKNLVDLLGRAIPFEHKTWNPSYLWADEAFTFRMDMWQVGSGLTTILWGSKTCQEILGAPLEFKVLEVLVWRGKELLPAFSNQQEKAPTPPQKETHVGTVPH